MVRFLLHWFQLVSELFLAPDQQNKVLELDSDENKKNLDGCLVSADTQLAECFPFHDRHSALLILDRNVFRKDRRFMIKNFKTVDSTIGVPS